MASLAKPQFLRSVLVGAKQFSTSSKVLTEFLKLEKNCVWR